MMMFIVIHIGDIGDIEVSSYSLPGETTGCDR
jgi:hypothetical protein